MPNLKYLNINGVNYSLGRDTRIHYGSTSETITDLQEGDLLIDLVEIPPAGKNLARNENVVGSITKYGLTFTTNSDGSVTVNGTNTRGSTVNYFFNLGADQSYYLDMTLPVGQYVLTGCPTGGATNKYFIGMYHHNNASQNWGTSLDIGSGKTYTVTADTNTGIGFRIGIASGQTVSNLTFKPMLRLASVTDATYESYKGNTYSVSFGSAGTVYGGTLDVVSGQLTVTYKSFTFDGTQAVTDRISSQNRVYYQISDMATGSFYSDNNVMCNRLEKVASVSSDATAPPATVIGYSNNYVYIQGVKNIGGANITDLASFNTWVSANNIVITYPLATPLTYQLTATQVALLRGDSKIWSDSGDTSVIYTNINDITSTASGSIANITSAKKALAQSVVTEINCKQDLNGYDNPWAGGAGKNKMPNNYESCTINSLTVTKQSDGSYKINGTASANTLLYIGNSDGTIITTPFASGNYILNGCPSGGSLSTYRIVAYLYSGSTYLNVARSDTGSGVGIDLSSGDGMRVAIDIKSGTQIDNFVFKPMIRLSTEQDASYTPYSNICPITGYNNINITKINPLYDTSETGTRMYKYNEDATWTEISVSGNGGLLNLENGSATGSVRGVNTFSEDGHYVMGQNAVAVGGSTQAAGANSFTSGLGTVAQRGSQAVFGEYNTLDTTGSTSTRGDYIFMLGNGTSNARSNATTIDWEGSIDTHGAITAGSIDNGYGLNDQALLASDTIALWEDIING